MGADGFRGTITFRAEGNHLPATPYTQTVRGFIEQSLTLVNGTGDDTADRILYQTGSIAISGTVDIDMQTVLDAFGDALNAGNCIAFALTAAAANVADINATPAPVNGWTGFMASGSSLALRPGGMIYASASKVGSRFSVGGTNKVLRLTNASGTNTASYEVLLFTRD